ncbi:hypothetical protein [Sporosarcina jiandibaonis]|uniref:hypothetical protein n=1 Tax=Sporosarcina jiandibaonis TaxID=2715535 RepID=UPI001557D064|nr:hypothetical protein [Sporosarcina jiandibaonis]
MQQWNGLLRKEWAVMGAALYITIGASIIFTLLIPLSNQLFNWGIEFPVIMLGVSIQWMMLGAGIPTVIFLISFTKEMNRLDIWLHSTGSIYKLFGSKMAFAGLVGAINTFIVLIINAFGLIVSGISFGPTFTAIVLLFTMLYLLSLLILCAASFVGVLYQLLNSYAKRMIAPTLLLLYFFSMWIIEKAAAMDFIEKIKGFGPIRGPSEGVYHFGEENFFTEIDALVFYMGDIFLGLLAGILFFMTAAALFEKKVRL